jgi:hypothetical protein
LRSWHARWKSGVVDDIAKLHREEVERKIRDLQAIKAELDRIIDTCKCGTVAECRIIETLSPTDCCR